MTEKEYLEERLNNQINWYDKKSKSCKLWFIYLSISVIFINAFIPLIILCLEQSIYLKCLIGFFSLLATFCSSIILLFNFHENWVSYRTTSETLKHYKYMYKTNCPPFHRECRFNELVQLCENVISKENSNWSQYIKKQNRCKDDNKNNIDNAEA